MPKGGIDLKGEQEQLLSELVHKQKTSTQYKKLLGSLINLETGKVLLDDLKPNEKASLRELRRDLLQEDRLTAAFVKKFAQTTIDSLESWKKAKANNNFRSFSPHLTKVVKLLKKKATLLGYEKHPYDALLDLYEPGITVEKLDALFIPLKEKLIALLHKIQSQSPAKRGDPTILNGHYPTHAQKEFCQNIVSQMQLSRDNSVLSETAHPFCQSLNPDDIRLTTFYDEKNLMKGLFATIHETGHGLYEHHLPKEHFGTPLAQAASFGIHESQSRVWETFIGQSRPFWNHLHPQLKKAFPDIYNNLSIEDCYKAINFVGPSMIRIFADEVTYNLHIILRYEIEKGLMDETIQVKDIPKIWNTKMQESFGITPKTAAEGCLQDIHWSLGYIGYFPSYCLGNLYAGALFEKLLKTTSNWESQIASGNFTFINTFMREKIHKHGRQFEPLELIEKATGSPFSIPPYLNYLTTKYS